MKAKNAARFHGRRGGPGTLAADLEAAGSATAIPERIKAEHAAAQPAEPDHVPSLFDEELGQC